MFNDCVPGYLSTHKYKSLDKILNKCPIKKNKRFLW